MMLLGLVREPHLYYKHLVIIVDMVGSMLSQL